METWVLLLLFASRILSFDMQNEDSCVLAAKELTLRYPAVASCVNTFDGKTLHFNNGKQT